MIRNLDNLRGDATTAGAEFHARLNAFKFREERQHDVFLIYDFRPCPRDCVLHSNTVFDRLEAALWSLRFMGWEAYICEVGDGTTAVLVSADGRDT